MLNLTRNEVENAVSVILGPMVYQALIIARMPLPRILEEAALKAFREDRPTDGNLDLVRGALLMLEEDGFFSFADEMSD